MDVIKNEDSKKIEVTLFEEINKNKAQRALIERHLNHDLSKIVLQSIYSKPFILTSERTGISLFYKELDINRNTILEEFSKNNYKNRADIYKILDKSMSRYALPIRDNINCIRDFEEILKKKSTLGARDCCAILQQIMQGCFKVENSQLFFSTHNKSGKIAVPMHRVSSAIKSLFPLDLYIRCLAEPGDVLMIDEPELNLHPDNQRLVARLLATLVNKGVRVFITTHSDFIMKEINNLIMLSNRFKGKKDLMKKYGYANGQLLTPDLVNLYTAEDGGLEKICIDPRLGFDLASFDSVICQMNESTEEIVYGITS